MLDKYIYHCMISTNAQIHGIRLNRSRSSLRQPIYYASLSNTDHSCETRWNNQQLSWTLLLWFCFTINISCKYLKRISWLIYSVQPSILFDLGTAAIPNRHRGKMVLHTILFRCNKLSLKLSIESQRGHWRCTVIRNQETAFIDWKIIIFLPMFG